MDPDTPSTPEPEAGRGDPIIDCLEWGNRSALDQLMPLVYRELRRLAAAYIRQERTGHTLQPTALVHEAYLRLVNQSEVQSQSRAKFFAIAANLMRQILRQSCQTGACRQTRQRPEGATP